VIGADVRVERQARRHAGCAGRATIETGTVVLHTAEAQGSLFLASLAEGLRGRKVRPVDLRALALTPFRTPVISSSTPPTVGRRRGAVRRR
jgi:hypothetical protein